MILEIDINSVYLFLLQRYNIVVYTTEKKCKCSSSKLIPIPVKKDKERIFMDGTCCSFSCLLKYVDDCKYQNKNMKYNYSLNVLWTILPFMIRQTHFNNNV
jgi:hypothetical protein